MAFKFEENKKYQYKDPIMNSKTYTCVKSNYGKLVFKESKSKSNKVLGIDFFDPKDWIEVKK